MKLVFSSGDINGIGLECFFKTLDSVDAELILVCNKNILIRYAQELNIKIEFDGNRAKTKNGSFVIENLDYVPELQIGKLAEDSGKHSALSIKKSLEMIDNGEADGFVTLPINKEAIKLSGWYFPGHTEFIADRYNISDFNMILTADDVRLAPLTIHLPLKEVADTIDKELIQSKCESLKNSLIKDFGIVMPKIAILGLNPHSGDGGKIGYEEIEIINPAIDSLDYVFGSFAADSFFAFKQYKRFDAIISMYHDQGLIPIKMLSDGAGVNYTSGLPIVRTSPDHGTAFEIAGKNLADEKSTINSALLAIEILNKRKINEN